MGSERVILAAGPWVVAGRRQVRRIVLHTLSHKPDEVVVHTECYDGHGSPYECMTLVSGDYFACEALPAAVRCWEKRNAANCHDATLATLAVMEEATLAARAVPVQTD